MAWIAVSMVPCAVMTTTCASGAHVAHLLAAAAAVDAGHADVQEDQSNGSASTRRRPRRRP
jgi:hypothetical protein